MKYLRFPLTTLFCAISICLSAQTIHKPGQYKIDHHIYVVSKLNHSGRLLVQGNPDLISRSGKTKNCLSRIKFTKITSKETIKSAFIKVLGMKRINELIPEKHVLVQLYFDTNGKVQAVEYFLSKNSKLMLKEINALTIFMKKNITFKIPSSIEKNGKLAAFSQVVKFNTLVN